MPSKQQNNVVRLNRAQQRTANRAVAGMKGKRKKLVEAHGGGLVELEPYVMERMGDKRKDGSRGPSTFFFNKDPANRIKLRALPGHPHYIADLRLARQRHALDPITGLPTTPQVASIPRPVRSEGTIGYVISLAEVELDQTVARGALKEVSAKEPRRNLGILAEDYGDVGIGDLNKSFVQRALDLYRDRPKAQRTMLQAWRLTETAALREQLILDDITHNLRLAPRALTHIAPWDLDALVYFLDHAPQHMADIIRLRAYTGLRRIDAEQLRHISIRPEGLIGTQSKTSNPFNVPWYDPLRQIVQDIAARQPDPSKPLLLKADGNTWTNQAWKQAFARLRARLVQQAQREGNNFLTVALAECKPHGLRSTAACLLMEALGDEQQVAAITGHEDLKSLRGYIRTVRSKLKARAAGQALAANQSKIPLL